MDYMLLKIKLKNIFKGALQEITYYNVNCLIKYRNKFLYEKNNIFGHAYINCNLAKL